MTHCKRGKDREPGLLDNTSTCGRSEVEKKKQGAERDASGTTLLVPGNMDHKLAATWLQQAGTLAPRTQPAVFHARVSGTCSGIHATICHSLLSLPPLRGQHAQPHISRSGRSGSRDRKGEASSS
jgi:hypothetical protein